jgi:hypothetical protein
MFCTRATPALPRNHLGALRQRLMRLILGQVIWRWAFQTGRNCFNVLSYCVLFSIRFFDVFCARPYQRILSQPKLSLNRYFLLMMTFIVMAFRMRPGSDYQTTEN